MTRAGELQRLREYLASTLSERGEILEKVTVSDGMGGQTESWPAVQVDVPCRIAFRSGATFVAGAKVQGESWWEITVPWGTQVSTQNRFRVNGQVYAITADDAGRTGAVSLKLRVDKV